MRKLSPIFEVKGLNSFACCSKFSKKRRLQLKMMEDSEKILRKCSVEIKGFTLPNPRSGFIKTCHKKLTNQSRIKMVF
jgi:hypothetical protein